MFTQTRTITRREWRRFLFMGRILPEVDNKVGELVEETNLNPKNLPTRRNLGLRRLPAQLEFAAVAKIKTISDANFRKEVKELRSIVYNSKLPDDTVTIKEKKADLKTELEIRDKLIKYQIDYDPTDQFLKENQDLARHELSRLIDGTIQDRRRDWHYYEYDEYASILYMAVRLPINYACIRTVMNEIRAADPSFTPSSILDFGSGMGTTTWAVNDTWPNSVKEFMNIEISKEQQSLNEFLLRGGKYSGEPLQGIYHRQYLPTSTKSKYDMVVASFSMLELPNAELRAHTIENLWQKTKDLLVIIERGNKGGFSIINEARHFILDLSGHRVTSRINKTYETRPKPDLFEPDAHVLAPCSHEFLCPRTSLPSKKNINICRFRTVFEPLDIGEMKGGYASEEFSYVVLRKRPPPPRYYIEPDDSKNIKWPRIVEMRKKSAGQLTFKLCCPNGNIAETVITKKYGKPLYNLAKACNWGDVLPIKVNDTYVSKNRSFIDKKTSSNKSHEQQEFDVDDVDNNNK